MGQPQGKQALRRLAPPGSRPARRRRSPRGDSLPRPSATTRLQEATHDSQRTRRKRRGPLHHQRRRLLGHRRRLRPRPRHRRPLVPLHGGTADRPQGHLGLPAQAAPRRRLHHQGHRGDGPLRRIPAVPGAASHGGDLDHPHRPAARQPGLARARIYPPGRVQLRARTTFCCWPRTSPTPRGCTTASWTGAAPCPCTAPGGTGCGGGAWTPARSSPWSPPGCWPTPATPGERSSRPISLPRWRRGR